MTDSIINMDDFLTMTGVHKVPVRDKYGETSVTTFSSVTTVACYAYTDTGTRREGNTFVTATAETKATVPTSLTVSIGDLMTDIKDQFGNSILVSGKITRIDEYPAWDTGTLFRTTILEVN